MHSTFFTNQPNLVRLSSEITRSHKLFQILLIFFTADLFLVLVVWFGITCASLQLAQLPVLSSKGEAFLPVEAVKTKVVIVYQ